MRLTKKIRKNKYEVAEEPFVIGNFLNRLGRIEDLEELIGIDIETLIVALFDGFYSKNHIEKIRFAYISTNKFNPDRACNKLPIVYCLAKSVEDIWLFKDYGKTWALTKEELESVSI